MQGALASDHRGRNPGQVPGGSHEGPPSLGECACFPHGGAHDRSPRAPGDQLQRLCQPVGTHPGTGDLGVRDTESKHVPRSIRGALLFAACPTLLPDRARKVMNAWLLGDRD